MRIYLYGLVAVLCTVAIEATSYIYTGEKLMLPLQQEGIILYSGTPVEIIKEKGDAVQVRIEGYRNKAKPTVLYATKNFELPLIKIGPNQKIEQKGEKYIVEVTVPKENITEDMEEAWAKGSDLFYDKCTKCHHAKIIEHHTMKSWDVLFGSMVHKAHTTPKENRFILRFLRAFAKDGILRES